MRPKSVTDALVVKKVTDIGGQSLPAVDSGQ